MILVGPFGLSSFCDSGKGRRHRDTAGAALCPRAPQSEPRGIAGLGTPSSPGTVTPGPAVLPAGARHRAAPPGTALPHSRAAPLPEPRAHPHVRSRPPRSPLTPGAMAAPAPPARPPLQNGGALNLALSGVAPPPARGQRGRRHWPGAARKEGRGRSPPARKRQRRP